MSHLSAEAHTFTCVYSLCEGHQLHQSPGADKDQASCHFKSSHVISCFLQYFQLPNHAQTLLSSQLAGHGSPTTCRGGSSPTCFGPGTDVEKLGHTVADRRRVVDWLSDDLDDVRFG